MSRTFDDQQLVGSRDVRQHVWRLSASDPVDVQDDDLDRSGDQVPCLSHKARRPLPASDRGRCSHAWARNQSRQIHPGTHNVKHLVLQCCALLGSASNRSDPLQRVSMRRDKTPFVCVESEIVRRVGHPDLASSIDQSLSEFPATVWSLSDF